MMKSTHVNGRLGAIGKGINRCYCVHIPDVKLLNSKTTSTLLHNGRYSIWIDTPQTLSLQKLSISRCETILEGPPATAYPVPPLRERYCQ